MQLYKLLSLRSTELFAVAIIVGLWSLLRHSVADGVAMLIAIYIITTIVRWDRWDKKSLKPEDSLVSRLWHSAHSKK